MNAKTETVSRALLWLLALAHACITFAYAVTRLYTFKGSLLDSGTFDQVLWNLLHHNGPISTTNPPFTPQHWLGFHFSPLVLALAPLYALLPYPELLQAVQSLCFAFAAIPLFAAARALGARQAEAWACVVLYGCNPFVISAALWDFHEIAFSTLLISVALWAICTGHFRALLASALLLLLTKEHYGISVAGMGLLWGWIHGDWRRGGALMLLGLGAAFLIVTVVMPYFSGGHHPMLGTEGHLNRYGWLQQDWPSRLIIFRTIFIGDGSPQMTGLMHGVLLLISGALYPLLAPVFLAPAAADLAANLLSLNPMPRHVLAYHGAACIPVVIIAGLRGYLSLCHRFPRLQPLIILITLGVAGLFPASGTTLLPLRHWELAVPQLHHDRRPLQEISAILGDAPVSAQPNIGMFFANRREIYPFPHATSRARFIVLYVFHPFNDPVPERFGIPYGLSADAYREAVAALMASPDWHVRYWHSPWVVLEQGPSLRDESEERRAIATTAGLTPLPTAPRE